MPIIRLIQIVDREVIQNNLFSTSEEYLFKNCISVQKLFYLHTGPNICTVGMLIYIREFNANIELQIKAVKFNFCLIKVKGCSLDKIN